MWPWAHAGLAYLLYAGYRHATDDAIGDSAAIAVVVGALLPDLIDKPLAWTVTVLPHGRSLGHSAITATLLTVALAWLATHRDRSEPYYALAVGVWTHLLGDALPTFEHVNYLLWPFLEPHPATIEPSFLAHVEAIQFTPWFLTQLAVTGLAALVWYRDGTPGLAVLDRR